ncbi:unnamed protein product, partial [Ectocarpus sp. 12 AP-2014]
MRQGGPLYLLPFLIPLRHETRIVPQRTVIARTTVHVQLKDTGSQDATDSTPSSLSLSLSQQSNGWVPRIDPACCSVKASAPIRYNVTPTAKTTPIGRQPLCGDMGSAHEDFLRPLAASFCTPQCMPQST